jgi:hypothetical protein
LDAAEDLIVREMEMGTWNWMPWENDEAADRYGDLMDETGLRDKWLRAMNADMSDSFDTVRAATGLFIMLGRVFIWPIDNYDEDLELAISKSQQLLQTPEYQEAPELLAIIQGEVQELKSRRTPEQDEKPEPSVGIETKPWWKFW